MSKQHWIYFGIAAAAAYAFASSVNSTTPFNQAYILGYNLATTGNLSTSAQ